MSDRFFRTEIEALMYSVTDGKPMDVRYAGDGYWATPRPAELVPDPQPTKEKAS